MGSAVAYVYIGKSRTRALKQCKSRFTNSRRLCSHVVAAKVAVILRLSWSAKHLANSRGVCTTDLLSIGPWENLILAHKKNFLKGFCRLLSSSFPLDATPGYLCIRVSGL